MYGQQSPANQFGTPYGTAQPTYGDFAPYEAGASKGPFARRRGARVNVASIMISWLAPPLIFCAVMSLQTFSLHYDSPEGCKTLCLLVLAAVVGQGVLAVQAWRSKFAGAAAGDPLWSTFLFLTCVLAWILAMVFGNKNFVQNMTPYRDVMNLNTYNSVSPADFRGQQLMDAGHINFANGTHLDLSYSMGFKNLDTYCVAPISFGNGTGGPLDSYDFWAVGLNCCSGHTPDFHCGEYNNVNALAGLRLMRDDLRSYFRLAVQQAEAAYNIHAHHPIFVYWMQDPQSEVLAYQAAAYKSWLVSSLAYLGAQLVLVILGILVFSKIGI